MKIEDLKKNLSKQVSDNVSPVVHTTLYYQEQGVLRTHLFVEGLMHFCGIKECPSNDN